MLNFIQTEDGIHTVIGGRMRTISAGDPHYAEVVEAIKGGADEAQVMAIIERELQKMQAAIEALHNRAITDDVKICGGQVLFRGKEVHNSLTERMLKQLDEGFDLVPMARFLENLMGNPSYRAVNDLYTFLEYGKMPITEDGCFLAYKAVRKDFRDIHSGTFDNTPGRPDPVEMPRNEVDDNPEVTCSRGLHVCSFEYLPSFAHADGHVVICKVNPRDVVSIPRDYNNTKMRLCRYWVIDEYKDYYAKKEDVLSRYSIVTEGKAYRVEIFGNYPDFEDYELLSEASKRAEELISYDSTERVVITNLTTSVVVAELINEDYVDEKDFDEEDFDETETDLENDYKVVYYRTKDDFEAGLEVLYDEYGDDLEEARSGMMNAYEEYTPYAVRIIEKNTGEVEHTFQ